MKYLMHFNKSTKGTHVYTSDDEAAPVSTLYVKRAALPASPPKTINVTIDEVEA